MLAFPVGTGICLPSGNSMVAPSSKTSLPHDEYVAEGFRPASFRRYLRQPPYSSLSGHFFLIPYDRHNLGHARRKSKQQKKPTVTDTNAAISEYFCCSGSGVNLLAPSCNVGRPSVSSLSPLPAHHCRMAASNGLTPTMFSTRDRWGNIYCSRAQRSDPDCRTCSSSGVFGTIVSMLT